MDQRHISLRKFLEMAQANVKTTFTHADRKIVRCLEELDELFRTGADATVSSGNDGELLLPYFLTRSHSAFLAGVRIVAGGQVAESYLLSRGCLEHALYAFFICDHPERALTWAKRVDGKVAARKCRDLFTAGNMKKCLVSKHEKLGVIASHLYDRTIQYGAPPNASDWLTTTDTHNRGGSSQMLAAGTAAWRLAMQTVAQAAACSIRIFGLLYGERFQALGVAKRLKRFDEFLMKCGDHGSETGC